MTELVKRLRRESPGPNHIATEAADKIEALEDKVASLEREVDARESWKDIIKQCDALQADNARLRGALVLTQDQAIKGRIFPATASPSAWFNAVCLALSATPEQSLARIRNHVRDECAALCDQMTLYTGYNCAAAIRAAKEPE